MLLCCEQIASGGGVCNTVYPSSHHGAPRVRGSVLAVAPNTNTTRQVVHGDMACLTTAALGILAVPTIVWLVTYFGESFEK